MNLKQIAISALLLSSALLAQVNQPQGPPVARQIIPGTGSGIGPITFQVQAQDTQANQNAANLTSIELEFASTSGYLDSPNCHAVYYMYYNVMGVYDASGNIRWMTPGSGDSQNGGNCTLSTTGAHFTNEGGGVGSAYFPITFNPTTFSGGHYAYVWVNANTPQGTQSSGWVRAGSIVWTVPTGSGDAVTSLFSGSGSGAKQTFIFQVTNTAPGGYIWVSIRNDPSPVLGGGGVCSFAVNPSSNVMNMVDDVGNWIGSTAISSGALLKNSQCQVDLSHASISLNGSTATWYVPALFLPSFAGSKYVIGAATNSAGQQAAAAQIGTWFIDSNSYGSEMVISPVAGGQMQQNDYDGGMSITETSAGLLIVKPRGSKKSFKLAHAGNVRVKHVSYSHEPDGDATKYTFHWDTTGGVNNIRLGASWDSKFAYENQNGDQQVGFTVSPHSQPAGWIGDGTGWLALAEVAPGFKVQPVKAVDSEFSVSSHYRPGLMAVYFMNKDWMVPVPQTGVREEDLALVKAGSFMSNSMRKFVIGPAIKPDATKDELLELVGHWVNDFDFLFLAPMIEGKSIDTITTEDPFELEILNCLKEVMPKQ